MREAGYRPGAWSSMTRTRLTKRGKKPILRPSLAQSGVCRCCLVWNAKGFLLYKHEIQN